VKRQAKELGLEVTAHAIGGPEDAAALFA